MWNDLIDLLRHSDHALYLSSAFIGDICPYIYLTIYLAVLLYADDISVLNRKLLP